MYVVPIMGYETAGRKGYSSWSYQKAFPTDVHGLKGCNFMKIMKAGGQRIDEKCVFY
jgi:hypothetical protein